MQHDAMQDSHARVLVLACTLCGNPAPDSTAMETHDLVCDRYVLVSRYQMLDHLPRSYQMVGTTCKSLASLAAQDVYRLQ